MNAALDGQSLNSESHTTPVSALQIHGTSEHYQPVQFFIPYSKMKPFSKSICFIIILSNVENTELNSKVEWELLMLTEKAKAVIVCCWKKNTTEVKIRTDQVCLEFRINI